MNCQNGTDGNLVRTQAMSLRTHQQHSKSNLVHIQPHVQAQRKSRSKAEMFNNNNNNNGTAEGGAVCRLTIELLLKTLHANDVVKQKGQAKKKKKKLTAGERHGETESTAESDIKLTKHILTYSKTEMCAHASISSTHFTP